MQPVVGYLNISSSVVNATSARSVDGHAIEVVRSEKRLSFFFFFFALGSPGVWQLHLNANGRIPKAAAKFLISLVS